MIFRNRKIKFLKNSFSKIKNFLTKKPKEISNENEIVENSNVKRLTFKQRVRFRKMELGVFLTIGLSILSNQNNQDSVKDHYDSLLQEEINCLVQHHSNQDKELILVRNEWTPSTNVSMNKGGNPSSFRIISGRSSSGYIRIPPSPYQQVPKVINNHGNEGNGNGSSNDEDTCPMPTEVIRKQKDQPIDKPDPVIPNNQKGEECKNPDTTN